MCLARLGFIKENEKENQKIENTHTHIYIYIYLGLVSDGGFTLTCGKPSGNPDLCWLK